MYIIPTNPPALRIRLVPQYIPISSHFVSLAYSALTTELNLTRSLQVGSIQLSTSAAQVSCDLGLRLQSAQNNVHRNTDSSSNAVEKDEAPLHGCSDPRTRRMRTAQSSWYVGSPDSLEQMIIY